jgi:hypothetical protein
VVRATRHLLLNSSHPTVSHWHPALEGPFFAVYLGGREVTGGLKDVLYSLRTSQISSLQTRVDSKSSVEISKYGSVWKEPCLGGCRFTGIGSVTVQTDPKRIDMIRLTFALLRIFLSFSLSSRPSSHKQLPSEVSLEYD